MTARSSIQDVWDFINPAKQPSELPSIPVLPNRPSAKDIVQTANSISDLSGTQVEDYKIRLSEWKETKSEIENIRRIMGSVQNKILGSISERLLPQLRGKSKVAEILSYLHKRYRPTDQARRQEVISRWTKVKMLPNDNSIISWLDEWELVYAEAKELNLPHVLDPQAQYDFLYSIENIAGAWTELKLAMIDDQARSGENFIEFYDLLESFRHKQRLNMAFNKNLTKSIGGSNSSGVFTISGSEQDTTHKDRDPKGAKNCLC
ncbi:DYN1, Dynein, heavy chain, partial [Thalictrum thalictroides]